MTHAEIRARAHSMSQIGYCCLEEAESIRRRFLSRIDDEHFRRSTRSGKSHPELLLYQSGERSRVICAGHLYDDVLRIRKLDVVATFQAGVVDHTAPEHPLEPANKP